MIYIHVPFCRSFCTYCGFYSEALPVCAGHGKRGDEMSRFLGYAAAVKAEASSRREELLGTLPSSAHPEYVDTLYIGGGTPSVLPPSVLSDVVGGLNMMLFGTPSHDYQEFTLEVNPEDIVEKGRAYLEAVAAAGVNRISMGVQSFDDGILKWMNRRHDAERAEKAFRMLREFPFENISIDLISGIGGMSDRCWAETLDRAVALRPEHISAYQLSVEEGSALARLADSGKYSEAPEEQCRRQYEMLCSRLGAAGYHHYEVSNFSLPGFEARHNSAYWRRVPYAGLGPGAHSAVAGPDGKVNVRKWNSESECGYVSDSEVLDAEDVRVEEIMLALRTDRGIDPGKLAEDTVWRLAGEGALERTEDGNVRIPESRLFVSDEIIRELI